MTDHKENPNDQASGQGAGNASERTAMHVSTRGADPRAPHPATQGNTGADEVTLASGGGTSASRTGNSDSRRTFRDDPTFASDAHQQEVTAHRLPAPIADAAGASRFEIIRSHAEGGLGEVFLARDLGLDREVALKEMKGNWQSTPLSRDRFEFEARVTGNLEHPCVVPVYALGTHPDGRPYYAMRFIRGETLQSAIKEFHRLHPRGRTRWLGTAFRNLLARLIATCNGVGFAHNKGVLHRDLKPANIMLGKYGETLVVDWGLAKYVGQKESGAAGPDTIMPSISGSNSSMTMEGSAMGTPGYMSPEQAHGNLDELTAATDIFSLGATLYAMMTGKPPFEGKSAREVIDRVKRLEFSRPRQTDPSVPKALEAICLKAMALRPEERYSTALELAADLEQFVAGEPVSCLREPLPLRAARFLRKHQTAATAAALLLVTIAVGALVGITLISAEQKRTAEALRQVVAEQARTSAALDAESAARMQTRESLSLITDDLVGQMLARKDQLEPADRALLQAILARFNTFTRTIGDSAEALEIQADGYRRVGNLQRRLGDLSDAIASYQQSAALLQQLLVNHPGKQLARFNLAVVVSNLGLAHAESGDDRAALDSCSEALGHFDQLPAGNPPVPEEEITLARAQLLGNRANIHVRLGQDRAAEADYRQAMEVLKPDPAADGDDAVQRELARQQAGFASLLASQPERRAEAIETWQRAIDGYRQQLVITRSAPDLVHETSVALANLGTLLAAGKPAAEAAAPLREAVAMAESLVETLPGFVRYRLLLGRNLILLARYLAETEPEQAEQLLARSETLLRDLQSEQPDNQRVRHELAEMLGVRALTARNSPELATRHFEEALELRRSLAELEPDNDTWIDERIATEVNFANHLRKLGEHERAAAQYRELLDFLDSRDPLDPRLIRATLFGLGDCLSQSGQYRLALDCWTRLVADPADPAWTRFEMQRAICLVRTGQMSAGMLAARKNAEASGEREPVLFYDAACCIAVALQQPELQDGLDAAALQEEALQWLRKAEAAGFFRSAAMRKHAATDHDLDALRNLAGFRTLCEELGIQ